MCNSLSRKYQQNTDKFETLIKKSMRVGTLTIMGKDIYQNVYVNPKPQGTPTTLN